MKPIFIAITITLALTVAGASVFAAEKTVQAAGKVIDPVCGMTVETKDAKNVYTYKGKKYYFCSKDEMEKFKAAPKKYIHK